MLVNLRLKKYRTTKFFQEIELYEALRIFQKEVTLSGFIQAKITTSQYNKVLLIYNMFGDKNLERFIRKHGDDFEVS